jgi:hypothetical protein
MAPRAVVHLELRSHGPDSRGRTRRWVATLVELDGKQTDHETDKYLWGMGVETVAVGNSASEALMGLSVSWNRAGFLE